MLFRTSSLAGFAVQATDGGIGTVSDLLFDDHSWSIRWLVIDTGRFMPGRKVLIHPQAVGMTVHDQDQLLVSLTKAQIEGSPDIQADAPVSRQMEEHLNDYYGWDPYWGSMVFGNNAIASPLSPPPLFGAPVPSESAVLDTPRNEGDPHLRSVKAVTGYHLHAEDGEIGHLEDFQADDRIWDIRYLAINTSNWWHGAHVLVPPRAVRAFDWSDHSLAVALTRDTIRDSPHWNPALPIDAAYEARLSRHYGWDEAPDMPPSGEET
jgi:hypothetical protein